MIPYNFNGRKQTLSLDELRSVTHTHTVREYALGERPIYKETWKRDVYALHRVLDVPQLVKLTGQTWRAVRSFIASERLCVRPIVVKRPKAPFWTEYEDRILLTHGLKAASMKLVRTYDACKVRRQRLRRDGRQ